VEEREMNFMNKGDIIIWKFNTAHAFEGVSVINSNFYV
jgi:hypothetical protein